MRQIDDVIAFGIDGPDDIAHRLDRLPGSVGNDCQSLGNLRISLSCLLAQHFAQAGNQRKIRSDVVVQIGSYTRAHPLQLNQPAQPNTICGVAERAKRKRDQDQKPPALPDRRQDPEAHQCGLGAGDAFRIYRPHKKAITPRSQTSKVNRALFSQRAPVAIGTEPILIAQDVARREA